MRSCQVSSADEGEGQESVGHLGLRSTRGSARLLQFEPRRTLEKATRRDLPSLWWTAMCSTRVVAMQRVQEGKGTGGRSQRVAEAE